jgi:hypothetical protein
MHAVFPHDPIEVSRPGPLGYATQFPTEADNYVTFCYPSQALADVVPILAAGSTLYGH